MTVTFWVLVLAVAYTYAGYPLVVALAARVLDRRVDKGPWIPSMSVVIAAYDEEDAIQDRILNLLSASYPVHKLEIIVASDGSTDGTVREASSLGIDRVRVLDLPRRGKAAALAEGVRRARGEILVFTDANTVFRPDALLLLAINFDDPQVGGVAGRTEYRLRRNGVASGKGESLYWRYDTWLKERESLTGSVVSAHGGMYAVRRELFRPVEDPAVTDDFAISTAVVAQGRRLVFEPRAVGFEEPLDESGPELRRRVRLMTREIRGVLLRRELLDPFRFSFYSVALLSRNVLRGLVPLALPVVLVLSWLLASTGPLYATIAWAMTGIGVLAVAGWALRARSAGRHPLLYVPFFFVLANVAAIAALVNVARGARIERWAPRRHPERESEPRAAEPTVGAGTS